MKVTTLLTPLLVPLLLTTQPSLAQDTALTSLPLTQNGGSWHSGHVQGIAVDVAGGYIYYSFTDLLAKYDFEGNLVGTLVGWTGHLGDLAFHPDTGKVYGSLEYKEDEAFYIAVIDVNKLNGIGIDAGASDIMRTVYLPEVVSDYTADMNGDGVFDGNIANTPDHRYGCSGIDGIAFGPAFGMTHGPLYLTVAYGIYSNTERSDNDHQVLLQYDISAWEQYARPLLESAPHHSGPATVDGKYFVYTGNTTYGVQNLSYDDSQQRWFMGVYQGVKPQFPNYLLFAIDADTPPMTKDLVGVAAAADRRWEQGLLLELADAGQHDQKTGIRGWQQKADVGLEAVGGGMFYLSKNSADNGRQSADLTLMRWTGDSQQPFAPVNDRQSDSLR